MIEKWKIGYGNFFAILSFVSVVVALLGYFTPYTYWIGWLLATQAFLYYRRILKEERRKENEGSGKE